MFTTGHQANVGALGTILGAGRHRGGGLGRPRLDPRRLHPLARQAAAVPAQPASTGSSRTLEKAADDGGGVLVVVDGVFSMEGDVAPLPQIAELCRRYGARLMVDEAHALGVLGARGAGACELLGVEDQVDLRMATFSKSLASCGGVIAGPAEVIEFLRVRRGRSCSPRRPCRPRSARRWRRSGSAARDEGRGCSPACSRTLATSTRPGRAWIPGRRADAGSPTGPRSSPRSCPVVIRDDWKAAFLWKALYDLGVYVNVALHPAVPPAGALLRSSVMATHDRETLDQALEIFARAKRTFESNHGPLPSRS